jgi:hypothetical protein
VKTLDPSPRGSHHYKFLVYPPRNFCLHSNIARSLEAYSVSDTLYCFCRNKIASKNKYCNPSLHPFPANRDRTHSLPPGHGQTSLKRCCSHCVTPPLPTNPLSAQNGPCPGHWWMTSSSQAHWIAHTSLFFTSGFWRVDSLPALFPGPPLLSCPLLSHPSLLLVSPLIPSYKDRKAWSLVVLFRKTLNVSLKWLPPCGAHIPISVLTRGTPENCWAVSPPEWPKGGTGWIITWAQSDMTMQVPLCRTLKNFHMVTEEH